MHSVTHPRHLAAWQWPLLSPAKPSSRGGGGCVRDPEENQSAAGPGCRDAPAGDQAVWLQPLRLGLRAQADKPVPSLLLSMPCSVPNSWDHRGRDYSTWACPQNGTHLLAALLEHEHVSHVRPGALQPRSKTWFTCSG